ncbi:MAG: cation:proton antiporter [Bacteroidales bacterium]|nr:cation:proton antiporter [Bacteroidales bacterium]
MNIEGLIADLALILVLGAVSTILFRKLKQPIVLGYIVAGFLVGPHFDYFPTIHNEDNIEFWAQIGIIVLLFSLGLEFSFKKLMNVGGSAIVTALIIVSGMMGLGVVVGHALDLSNINCLFLGGMLSMSSTTIIIKAFNDLGLNHRRFVPHVLAVLICEDLFAVVMMVLLSSIALNNSVEGSELLMSIGKLVFFLVIWFTVGVYVIPSFFKWSRRLINDEILLVVAMGMCFLMAVFSVYSGFSMALGAFVMGSILAGTCEAEHIERLVKPVKDLFGAVFFISVGMMVDTGIIAQYAGTIATLSVVVIAGMIVFGTFGMLATGQSLKIAIESGFSLTQIGEFAFIIASLGLSLNVLEPSLYPIVVAVSVITTFFTPYFIKFAEPAYEWLLPRMPQRVKLLLDRYTKQESASVSVEKKIWKAVLGRYAWRILLYSTLLIAIIVVSDSYLLPIMDEMIGETWGDVVASGITLTVMAPFLLALSMPSTKRSEWEVLEAQSGSRSTMPLVALSIVRLMLAFGLVSWYLSQVFTFTAGVTIGFGLLFIIVVFLSKKVRRRMREMEKRFLSNLNERELRRSGRNSTLVSDLHVAYIHVGYNCPFVGERLRDSNLRKRYGVNVVSIQRGAAIFPIPTGDMRLFPGDLLGIVGTDEQIQRLLPIVEDAPGSDIAGDDIEMKLMPIEVKDGSLLVGKTAASVRLRDDYQALLVAIQRGEDDYIKPDGSETFEPHDTLWVVGNETKLAALCQ